MIRNQEWPDIQSFIHFAKISRLNANIPLLLTSDGTLTRSLQALVRSPIYLEVIRQETHGIEEEAAQHLDIDLKKVPEALFREVWLQNEQRERLVYARSILPVEALSPSFYHELSLKKRTIGDLIESLNLPSLKDKMSFSRVSSMALVPVFGSIADKSFRASDPQVGKECYSAGDSELWSRRYRLSVPNQILASIEEVFSPSLFNSSFSIP
ncbi:MAG: chorismate lyase [Nitrospirae bacterium]|nr:chorismate lyase [Nitrospirota bacterium]